jgi:hypothetical protein
MKRATFLLPALTLLLGVVGQAAAGPTTIDLGTKGNAANWLITGAGAKDSPARQVDVEKAGEISLTSNAEENGTFVKGGTLSKFNGFWTATETFSLPSNATNVSLKFSGLFADDRVVLELNPTAKNPNIIGNATFNGNNGKGVISLPGPGDSDLPSPPSTNFTFTNITSDTIKAGFALGNLNQLVLVVNNTDHETLTDKTVTFQNPDDATEAGLVASVTYNVPSPTVPEPTGLTLAAVSLGGIGMGAWRRWRQRRLEVA